MRSDLLIELAIHKAWPLVLEHFSYISNPYWASQDIIGGKTGMDESQLMKDWLVYEYEKIHVESDIEETVGVRGWQLKL